jgi:hypothetical protein
MTTTRKTHIVRIYNNLDPTKTGDQRAFVDVEVLDAISFKTTGGKEMILNVPAQGVVPYIVDDTGDGNGKTPSDGTRRSHMERITNPSDPTQFFDVEVLDIIAFDDENGGTWVLSMPSAEADTFNASDDTGDSQSTRRVHSETVTDLSVNGGNSSGNSLTVERADMIAFRGPNNEEMIIECPSSDDGSGAGRAETETTPSGYTTAPGGPVPPENTDPSIYVAFVKGKDNDPIPATSVTVNGYYVWWGDVPIPTLANYTLPDPSTNDGAAIGGSLQYVGDAAAVYGDSVFIFSSDAAVLGEPLPPAFFRGDYTGGFRTLADAQTYADVVPAMLNPGGFYTPGFFREIVDPSGVHNFNFSPTLRAITITTTIDIPAFTPPPTVGGPMTGDAKIAQGPLWWIRNASVPPVQAG